MPCTSSNLPQPSDFYDVSHPMHAAARAGDIGLLRTWFYFGSGTSGLRECLDWAIRHNYAGIVSELVKVVTYNKVATLYSAAFCGHTAVARVLLANGADLACLDEDHLERSGLKHDDYRRAAKEALSKF